MEDLKSSKNIDREQCFDEGSCCVGSSLTVMFQRTYFLTCQREYCVEIHNVQNCEVLVLCKYE